MDDTASPLAPAAAARLAELETLVAAQRAALDEKTAALDEERLARANAEAERDRLREAYEALTREVELARRRLVVAKAERVDTTQLELEFAAKLAELDKLSRKAEDEIGEKPERERKKKQPRGRRDFRLIDLPEERVEIPDPLLEGKAARIGTEDSIGLRWRRGGPVRVVFARIKYDATKPAMATAIATPTTATPDETPSELPADTVAPSNTSGSTGGQISQK